MKQAGCTTKDKILAVALDLFSVHGYASVSIRDIGGVVGIKESSIYAHFKNKEDILQTLLQRAEEQAQIKKDSFNQALARVSSISCEGFVTAGLAYVEGYLIEESIYKFIQVLTLEKQHNAQAAELYHKLLFTEPLEHHKTVFSFLVEKKFIQADEPLLLANEYQALILYVFHKYFSTIDALKTDVNVLAAEELSLLLRRFYKKYFIRESAHHESL